MSNAAARVVLVLVVGLGALATPAAPASAATTRTWIGPQGGSWSTAANWSPEGVPQDGDAIAFTDSSSAIYDLGDLTISSLTTSGGAFSFVTVGQTQDAGRLRLTGGLAFGATFTELSVELELLAGEHEVAGDGELGELSGSGSLRKTSSGGLTIGATAAFTGSLMIEEGGVLTTDGVGSLGSGTSIAPGAQLFLQYATATQAEPITVLAGAGPAAQLTVSRSGGQPNVYSGSITLEGDLQLVTPVTIAGSVSGAGDLTLAPSQSGFAQPSAVSGTVDVGDLVLLTDVSIDGDVAADSIAVHRNLTVAGADPLGQAPVAVSAQGTITVLPDGSLANPLSFVGPTNSNPPGQSALQLGDGSLLSGSVSITGTAFLKVTVVGEAAVEAPISSTILLDLHGALGQPSRLSLPAASDLPGVSVTSLVVDLDDSAATESIGAVQVIAAQTSPVFGTLNFGATGQHDPATPLTVGHTGVLDLWGTDQGASQVTVHGGGSLFLGVVDGVVDASRLTVSGAFAQQNGSAVGFSIGVGQHDEIRASSVSLAGDVALFHDGTTAVGQSFRVIENTGIGPVQGTFAGAPQGAYFATDDGRVFRVSYAGGTGNDVTLTNVGTASSSFDFSGVQGFGGRGLDSPALSSWGAGRLDAFVTGTDGSLWHTPNGGGRWDWLGGRSVSGPAAVSQGFGTVDAFMRGTDNQLWMRSYRQGWQPWVNLGGFLTESPAAASQGAGSLDVVARGGDGQVWHRAMRANVWQSWQPLGGFTGHAPTIVSPGPGLLHLFVRGGDGQVWTRAFAGGVWGPWGPLGGAIVDGVGVAATEPGELMVFAPAVDGNLWARSLEHGVWQAWANLGHQVTERPAAVGQGTAALSVGFRLPNGSVGVLGAQQRAGAAAALVAVSHERT